MNLVYNILWVENEFDWYEETKSLVESILEEEGFKLKTTYKKSEADISELIEKDGLKTFDLILIDFNLDSGDTGNVIIENIRDSQIFTDIIFYSQNLEGIKDAIKKHELEGIYLTKRDRIDFESKFGKVFKTTIKKIQDISAIRGLVMAETSRLDRKIEDIIIKFYDISKSEHKTRVQNYILDKLTKSTKDSMTKAEKLKENTDIKNLIKERIFDSYKKVLTVGEIIDIVNKPNIVKKEQFIKTYNEEVIDLRNHLAHVEESEDKEGNPIIKMKAGEIIIDDGYCRKIRSNIIKQEDVLNNIFNSIS